MSRGVCLYRDRAMSGSRRAVGAERELFRIWSLIRCANKDGVGGVAGFQYFTYYGAVVEGP